MTHFVLLRENMRAVGGIEMIVIRLANYLASQQQTVTVISSDGEMNQKLDSGVQRIGWHILQEQPQRCIEQLTKDSPEKILLISFESLTGAAGAYLRYQLVKNYPQIAVAHTHGVYHPRAFFYEAERLHSKCLNYLLGYAIGLKRFFFMNIGCWDTHAAFWGEKKVPQEIIPTPMEDRPVTWQPELGDKLRIISVGRILDFKRYNFHIPAMVKTLADEHNIQVQWDIYGHGPEEQRLQDAILQAGVQEQVTFHGTLEYSRMDALLPHYDLFIGMGTAAIHAAQLGVPTLCAIDQSGDETYGYMHEVPYGIVGEQRAEIPRSNYLDRIIAYVKMDDTEKRRISAAGAEAMAQYNLPFVLSRLQEVALPVSATLSTQISAGFGRAYMALAYPYSALRKKINRMKSALRKTSKETPPHAR